MKISTVLSAAWLTVATMAADVHAQTVLLSMKASGADHPFWAAVEQGGRAMAAELGVDIVVSAPATSNDTTEQLQQIKNQWANGVAAMVIAPTDPDVLAPLIDETRQVGIAVVFIETQGNNEGIAYIGTDHVEGANLAADYICSHVAVGSDVAILQGMANSAIGLARAQGVKQGFRDCGLNLVAEQSAAGDRARAQAVAEKMLNGNAYLKAIFASNAEMALGAVEALRASNLLGHVLVVGFGVDQHVVQAILAGELAATVAENPKNMGAFGVEQVLQLLNGEMIPAVIDTGTVLVTQENAAEYP